MAISKTRIENRIRPWLTMTVDAERLGMHDADTLLEIFNEVMHDLNREAELNVERFYKLTGTDNAEDAEATNYLVQGNIERVMSFRLEDSDWDDVEYSYINDRLLLNQTSDDAQMDVLYLRQCEELSAASDEIDLPFQVEKDYFDLLKYRLLHEFGGAPIDEYMQKLEYYANKACQRVDRPQANKGQIRRNWFFQTDDERYMITNKHATIENWVVDISGNYQFVDYV